MDSLSRFISIRFIMQLCAHETKTLHLPSCHNTICLQDRCQCTAAIILTPPLLAPVRLNSLGLGWAGLGWAGLGWDERNAAAMLEHKK